MPTATNPETGEKVELIDGQWVPVQQQTGTFPGAEGLSQFIQQESAPAQEPDTFDQVKGFLKNTLQSAAGVPQGIAQGAGDILSSAQDLITGESRQTRATEELPELGFGGLLSNIPALDVLKIAPGLLLSGPEERAQILSQIPGIGIITDEKGNQIAVNKETGAHSVINKPGLSGTDIVQGAATTAAFTPSAAVVGLAPLKAQLMTRLLAGGAGAGLTQSGIEAAQAGAGGEFDLPQVGASAALGAGAELLGPLARGLKPGRRPAEKIIREEVAKTFPSPESVKRKLFELGPEARLVDIGESTKGLGIGAAIKSPAARQRLDNFLVKRATGASSRIKSTFRKQFGAKGDDFADFAENSIAKRAEQSRPLYEAARAKSIEPQAIDDLLGFANDIANSEKASGHPAVRSAVRKLKESLVRKVDGDIVPKTSVDGIDVARETFGENIWNMRRTGKVGNKLYGELVKIRDKFDDVLPSEYIEANKIFSSESKVMDAYDLGKKFFTTADDELAQLTRTMSEADRDGLMAGIAKAVSTKIGKRVPTGQIPKALATEEFIEKLNIVLPGDLATNFMKAVESEGVFSATRNAITGGSQTALNIEAQRRLTSAAAEAIPFSKEALAKKFLRRGVTESVANEVSATLVGNLSSAQIDTLLASDIPAKALPSAARAMVQLLNQEKAQPTTQTIDELLEVR
jgi:hypothetical protein